ncbi:NADH-quinone oxidoreductase subunit NuoF [Rubellicoccus peritrichatus]|uniref:NADH-quinone oxidoreductase subunit NuoF n=1 Tax=Rubellicoccus peritrichatus TaxID=3080537 RepID=A0AAQ3QU04_9BACT|nr:NADH-quinone oxidoreductase subunit NuoF [Puniceicoccus sp. CR14]WOO39480.1 NADH-quinone oxidoreductase subunit NuoF [Puniceicoccus sp. CR14]
MIQKKPPEEFRLIYKNVDVDGYTIDIDCYRKHDGYKILEKAIKEKPEDLRQEVLNSGVRGRGGAGFPTGMKWKFVDRKSGKPIYVVCNADESEPGTYKDRQIIYKDPHQLIEGIMISAFANNAAQAFIYIRGEFINGARILERAIDEARKAGFVGKNICGSEYSCEIAICRGAGAYICGEETGLIESLEGKRGYPRIKPPYFPAVLGLYQCPTIVNNVETFCHVKHVIDRGGEEYAKIGIKGDSGTHIWGVSGHVQRPGYYELEAGSCTFGDLLYGLCGGPLPGRKFKALIPGGSSTKILRFGERFEGKLPDGTPFDWAVEDIPLDANSIGLCGTFLGTGGSIVMDDSTDMLEALANLNAFYGHESCGQCTPCREGSLWLQKMTGRMCSGSAREEDVPLLKDIADQVAGRTICAHGEAVAWPVQSAVPKFKDEYLEKIKNQASGQRFNPAGYPLI